MKTGITMTTFKTCLHISDCVLRDFASFICLCQIRIYKSTDKHLHCYSHTGLHSYIDFCGFILPAFSNTQCRHKNKNTSLGPLNGQKHKIFSTTRTDPYRVMFKELKNGKQQLSKQCFCPPPPPKNTHTITLFRRGGGHFRGGSWNLNTTKSAR